MAGTQEPEISAAMLEMITRAVTMTLDKIDQAGRMPAHSPGVGAVGGDDFKNFLKEMVDSMKKPSGGGGGGGRAILDERNFRRLEKFTNKESDWDAWQANVEVAVAAVHINSWKMMEKVAGHEEVNADILRDVMDDVVEGMFQ